MQTYKKLSRMLRMALGATAVAFSAAASAAPYVVGDVFASIGNGLVQVYSQDGTLKQTLDTTVGGYTTGSTFDKNGNFYVTAFSANVVSKFNSNGALVDSAWANGISRVESIVFDAAGNAYLGNAGSANIQKMDSNGNEIARYATLQNTDWIDLAADQTTLLYSNEGSTIRELNTNTLVDTVFTSGSYAALFAKRYLADGGVLAASSNGNVYRWDSAGNLVFTYNVGIGSIFALNLDPDGTSFWTGVLGGQRIVKVALSDGAILQDWNTTILGQGLYGLSVYGEIQAGGGGGNGGGNAPEPFTLALVGLGLVGVAASRRRKA
jgi:WD40 repeat protein